MTISMWVTHKLSNFKINNLYQTLKIIIWPLAKWIVSGKTGDWLCYLKLTDWFFANAMSCDSKYTEAK